MKYIKKFEEDELDLKFKAHQKDLDFKYKQLDAVLDYQDIINKFNTGNFDFEELTNKLKSIKNKYSQEILDSDEVFETKLKALRLWSEYKK